MNETNLDQAVVLKMFLKRWLAAIIKDEDFAFSELVLGDQRPDWELLDVCLKELRADLVDWLEETNKEKAPRMTHGAKYPQLSSSTEEIITRRRRT
jgi:hypothetical protein